jgi:hypothetical protein
MIQTGDFEEGVTAHGWEGSEEGKIVQEKKPTVMLAPSAKPELA